jgi:MoxR-like ATPase
VLRHRVLPNFTAESEGLTAVKLVDQIVERVKA